MIKFLSKEQLLNLTTQRLLAYKNKLMTAHETPDWDDLNSISKEHPIWRETYQNVKEILSIRENVK